MPCSHTSLHCIPVMYTPKLPSAHFSTHLYPNLSFHPSSLSFHSLPSLRPRTSYPHFPSHNSHTFPHHTAVISLPHHACVIISNLFVFTFLITELPHVLIPSHLVTSFQPPSRSTQPSFPTQWCRPTWPTSYLSHSSSLYAPRRCVFSVLSSPLLDLPPPGFRQVCFSVNIIFFNETRSLACSFSYLLTLKFTEIFDFIRYIMSSVLVITVISLIICIN